MCPDLPGNQNRPSRAPRAHSPCKIALYPGRALFWPPRGARRDPGVRFRLIRAVSTRELSGRVSIRHPGPNRVGASGDGRARSRRKVLRLYRHPTAEARSPPARSACFPHPVQVSQRSVRAAVQKAYLVVYCRTTKQTSLWCNMYGSPGTGGGGATLGLHCDTYSRGQMPCYAAPGVPHIICMYVCGALEQVPMRAMGLNGHGQGAQHLLQTLSP